MYDTHRCFTVYAHPMPNKTKVMLRGGGGGGGVAMQNMFKMGMYVSTPVYIRLS